MRTANMLPFYNCTFKDLANITFHDRSIEPATLIQLDKTSGKVVTTDQFDMLEADIAELKPTIVVIDNRSQIFSGNENDRTAAQEACRPLQRLARTYKCAIILAMHPSLAGIREGTGHSGTTGWEGAVRQFDYLSFLNEDDRSSGVRLEIVKTNYGAPGGDPIELVWRNGFMENANLYVGDKPAPGKRRAEIKAERVFIKLLRRNTQRGLPISPSPTSQLYAPRIFERDKEREGLQKKHFELAMHALMDSGRVVVEVRWGLNKNKVRVLVEVEDFMGK
jgi:hypothetical protein